MPVYCSTILFKEKQINLKDSWGICNDESNNCNRLIAPFSFSTLKVKGMIPKCTIHSTSPYANVRERPTSFTHLFSGIIRIHHSWSYRTEWKLLSPRKPVNITHSKRVPLRKIHIKVIGKDMTNNGRRKWCVSPRGVMRMCAQTERNSLIKESN